MPKDIQALDWTRFCTRLILLSFQKSSPEIQQALNNIRTQRYRIFAPDIAEPELTRLIGFPHDEFIGSWFLVDAQGLDLDELYVVGDAEQLTKFEEEFKLARFCPTSEATSDEIGA